MREEFQRLFHSEPFLPSGNWISAEGPWQVQTQLSPLRFYCLLDSDHILFGASVEGIPRELTPPPAAGEYREGLWQADVIELFLFTNNAFYFEMNLAFRGAWWSMSFSDYRRRNTQHAKPKLLAAHSERLNDGWRAALLLSASFCRDRFPDWPNCSGNLCAVLGERYFSVAPPRSLAADFHSPRVLLHPRAPGIGCSAD